MNNPANPLIGPSIRETLENTAEALSAAVVLMTDKHSDLCRLLTPVLQALEREDVVNDADAIECAAEAFSAAIVLMADRHSDLCRLLMPVLQAVEHASEAGASDDGGTVTVEQDNGVPGDPIAEYNHRAAQVRATCEA